MTHEMIKTRLPANVAEAIRENMSDFVGAELQKLLNGAMATKVENERLLEENRELEGENGILKLLKFSDRALKKRKDDLDEMEQKLNLVANNAVQSMLEGELKVEKKCNEFLKDICQTLAGKKPILWGGKSIGNWEWPDHPRARTSDEIAEDNGDD